MNTLHLVAKWCVCVCVGSHCSFLFPVYLLIYLALVSNFILQIWKKTLSPLSSHHKTLWWRISSLVASATFCRCSSPLQFWHGFKNISKLPALSYCWPFRKPLNTLGARTTENIRPASTEYSFHRNWNALDNATVNSMLCCLSLKLW